MNQRKSICLLDKYVSERNNDNLFSEKLDIQTSEFDELIQRAENLVEMTNKQLLDLEIDIMLNEKVTRQRSKVLQTFNNRINPGDLFNNRDEEILYVKELVDSYFTSPRDDTLVLQNAQSYNSFILNKNVEYMSHQIDYIPVKENNKIVSKNRKICSNISMSEMSMPIEVLYEKKAKQITRKHNFEMKNKICKKPSNEKNYNENDILKDIQNKENNSKTNLSSHSKISLDTKTDQQDQPNIVPKYNEVNTEIVKPRVNASIINVESKLSNEIKPKKSNLAIQELPNLCINRPLSIQTIPLITIPPLQNITNKNENTNVGIVNYHHLPPPINNDQIEQKSIGVNTVRNSPEESDLIKNKETSHCSCELSQLMKTVKNIEQKLSTEQSNTDSNINVNQNTKIITAQVHNEINIDKSTSDANLDHQEHSLSTDKSIYSLEFDNLSKDDTETSYKKSSHNSTKLSTERKSQSAKSTNSKSISNSKITSNLKSTLNSVTDTPKSNSKKSLSEVQNNITNPEKETRTKNDRSEESININKTNLQHQNINKFKDASVGNDSIEEKTTKSSEISVLTEILTTLKTEKNMCTCKCSKNSNETDLDTETKKLKNTIDLLVTKLDLHEHENIKFKMDIKDDIKNIIEENYSDDKITQLIDQNITTRNKILQNASKEYIPYSKLSPGAGSISSRSKLSDTEDVKDVKNTTIDSIYTLFNDSQSPLFTHNQSPDISNASNNESVSIIETKNYISKSKASRICKENKTEVKVNTKPKTRTSNEMESQKINSNIINSPNSQQKNEKVTTETQTSPKISEEYRELAGQFILDNLNAVRLYDPSELYHNLVVIDRRTNKNTSEKTFSSSEELWNSTSIHENITETDNIKNVQSSSFSDGEIMSCSIGEIHNSAKNNMKQNKLNKKIRFDIDESSSQEDSKPISLNNKKLKFYSSVLSSTETESLSDDVTSEDTNSISDGQYKVR